MPSPVQATRWVLAGLVLALAILAWRRSRPGPAVADASPGAAREPGRAAPAVLTAGTGAAVAAVAPPAPVPLERQLAERLLARLAEKTDAVEREAAAQEAAGRIPRALLGDVLTLLQGEGDRPFAAEAIRALLLRWAWEEPTGAAVWTLQSATGATRREALGAVAAGWARQSPDTLAEWAAGLEPAERDWVLLHGAGYLARTDLDWFSMWQSALPATRERDQLLADTARFWAGRDPVALAAQLEEFSGPGPAAWRHQIAAGLAGELSQSTDLADALAVIAVMPAGPEQQTVLTGLVAGWARREPTAIAAWLEGLPDLPARARLSVLLAGNWLAEDPAEAKAWARSLPPGPVAEAVAERITQHAAAPGG